MSQPNMSARADTLPEGQSTWESLASCAFRPVVSPVLGLVEEQFAGCFVGHPFPISGRAHAHLFQDVDGQAFCSRTSSSSMTAQTAGLSRGVTCSSPSFSSSNSNNSSSGRGLPGSGASSAGQQTMLDDEQDARLVAAACQALPLGLTKSYSSPELTAYTTPVALHQGFYSLTQHGSRRSMEDDPEVAAWRHLTMQEMLPLEYASSCSSSGHGCSWARSLAASSSTYASSSMGGSGFGILYACESSCGNDNTDSSAGYHSFQRTRTTPSRLAGHNSSSHSTTSSSMSKPVVLHSAAGACAWDTRLAAPCEGVQPVAEIAMPVPGQPPCDIRSPTCDAQGACRSALCSAKPPSPAGMTGSCSGVAAAAALRPASGRHMLVRWQGVGREMKQKARHLGEQLGEAAVGLWDAGSAAARGFGKCMRRGAAHSKLVTRAAHGTTPTV